MLKRLVYSNTSVSLLTNVGTALLGLITFSLMTRWMSKSDMGDWLFFMSIFLLFDLVRGGMLQMALVRLKNQPENKEEEILGSSWLMTLVLTLLITTASVIFYLIAWFCQWEAIYFQIAFWMPLILLVGIPYNMGLWVFQADASFSKALIIRFVLLFTFLGGLAFFYFNNSLDLYACFIAYAASYLFAGLTVFLIKGGGLRHIRKTRKYLVLEIFHFGKFSMATVIASNLLRTSDTLILRFCMGPSAVSLYGVPFKFIELLEMPLRSVVSVFIPKMAKAAGQQDGGKEAARIYMSYTGVMTLLFIPVVLVTVLLAGFIITTISGEEYLSSAVLLRILIVYCLFLPLDRFSGVALDMLNRPAINFRKVCLMLSINVIGDLAAIYFFNDLRAVAAVSILTFFSGLVFGNLYVAKLIPVSFRQSLQMGFKDLLNAKSKILAR